MSTQHNVTRIHKIRVLWRDIHEVTWSDTLNGRRRYSDLYRKVEGKWRTGEAFPVGVRHSGLFRFAIPEIETALNNFVSKP